MAQLASTGTRAGATTNRAGATTNADKTANIEAGLDSGTGRKGYGPVAYTHIVPQLPYEDVTQVGDGYLSIDGLGGRTTSSAAHFEDARRHVQHDHADNDAYFTIAGKDASGSGSKTNPMLRVGNEYTLPGEPGKATALIADADRPTSGVRQDVHVHTPSHSGNGGIASPAASEIYYTGSVDFYTAALGTGATRVKPGRKIAMRLASRSQPSAVAGATFNYDGSLQRQNPLYAAAAHDDELSRGDAYTLGTAFNC